MSLNTDSMQDIMKYIGTDLPSDLVMSDFKDFGKMTSHIYRAKFYTRIQDLVDKGFIKKSSVGPIIYFATLIKNKKRIIDGLNNLKPKYGTSPWFEDALKYYQTETDQYVSESEKSGRFPVVNIPSCQPDVAAHFFKMQLMRDGVSRSDVDIFKMFFQNLWFPQLRVTKDLLDKHKEWERGFWNEKVKKSKNPDSTRFERGFNEDYWETKAADDYQFSSAGKPLAAVMDEAAIVAWIKS